MNLEIDDDIDDALLALLKRTNDEFGLTLSGCSILKETVDKLRNALVELKAKLPPGPEGENREDPMIGFKRIAF
jgi:hypothetical protein